MGQVVPFPSRRRAAEIRRQRPPETVFEAGGWRILEVPAAGQFNAPTVSGNTLTLSWVGEGELEFSYYANGPWFQAVNQANPQNVDLSTSPSAQTFYRIRSY